MDSISLQWLLALAMLITTAVAGIIPLKIVTTLTKDGVLSKRSTRRLSMMSCFSGGVFLSTCFLDIIPQISETYAVFLRLSGLRSDFPFPYLFICIGFFLVYLMEEACIRLFVMAETISGPIQERVPVKNRRESIRAMAEDGTQQYTIVQPGQTSFLSSLTFAIAISFHSLLEGFALGIQDTASDIVTLFVSLLIHKSIEAFTVGVQVCRGNAHQVKAVCITILVYSLMTPIGSILGVYLKASDLEAQQKIGLVLILESLAAGTFIYVTFIEILAGEKGSGLNSLKQLLAIFAGFVLIVIVQFGFSNTASAFFTGQ